jgi:hypothetical protein
MRHYNVVLTWRDVGWRHDAYARRFMAGVGGSLYPSIFVGERSLSRLSSTATLSTTMARVRREVPHIMIFRTWGLIAPVR